MKKREPVSHIMTPDPYVLNLNDGLSHAEILFKKHTVRHLPVVSGDGICQYVCRGTFSERNPPPYFKISKPITSCGVS